MNLLKKINFLLILIIIIPFLLGFSIKFNLSLKSFYTLKKSLKNGEIVKKLSYKEFQNVDNYRDLFYIDDYGVIDFVSDDYIFNKKHIVFKVHNNTKFKDFTKYKSITNIASHLKEIYPEGHYFEKINSKNINEFNKQKNNIVDNDFDNNLSVNEELYKIGAHHKAPSDYGGCGPVAEYIIMQYFINTYGFHNLLNKRYFRTRNISYLHSEKYNLKKQSEQKINKLKFADYIYENTPISHIDSENVATFSSQMIQGLNNTVTALGLNNVISFNRTNIFQQRVWRIMNNILNGFPSLIWTYNQKIAENNHWIVAYGYETWKITNLKTQKTTTINFLKVTSDSKKGNSTYIDENKLVGIWGMIEVKAKNNKMFSGNQFNLTNNYYYNYNKNSIMRNNLNETLDINYTRAGYVQSYYRPNQKNGMFNALSAISSTPKKAQLTLIDHKGISGLTFNIAIWGPKEDFNPSTDYVRLLVNDNELIYNFNIEKLYKDRYMLDLYPFIIDFNRKVYKVTLEVYKKNTYHNNWNRGRIVIDNLIVNE